MFVGIRVNFELVGGIKLDHINFFFGSIEPSVIGIKRILVEV